LPLRNEIGPSFHHARGSAPIDQHREVPADLNAATAYRCRRARNLAAPHIDETAIACRAQVRCSALLLAFLLAGATPAAAADTPMQAMTPEPATTTLDDFEWTGFNIGIHGGFGVDHFGFKYSVASPVAEFSGTDGITGVGPIGGLQIGFTYQFPFTLVLPYKLVAGLEFDASWSGIKGQTDAVSPSPPGQGYATFGSKFLSFGTARLRLGYGLGRLFPYITGGFTYGIVETYGNAGPIMAISSPARPRCCGRV
jgi:hypothetical protein